MDIIPAVNYETLNKLKLKKLIPYIKKKQDFQDPLDINLIGSLTNINKEDIKQVFNSFKKSFIEIEKNNSCVQIKYLSNEIVPYFLYQGNLDLIKTNCITIAGTRTPSPFGFYECSLLTSYIGMKDFTIVSGLARGIDTVALKNALEKNFNTIGVIATPINKYYPKENQKLQNLISKEGLLISPIAPNTLTRKWHFLLRNKLMVNISLCSVVIEAFDGGGSTRMAEYSTSVNKPVFIPKFFYENKVTTWQKKISSIYPYVKYSEIPKAIENQDFRKSMEKRIQRELF